MAEKSEKKEKGTAIDLKAKMALTITKKGAEMKSNTFAEGDVIEAHPHLGAYFIKHGVATATKKKGE